MHIALRYKSKILLVDESLAGQTITDPVSGDDIIVPEDAPRIPSPPDWAPGDASPEVARAQTRIQIVDNRPAQDAPIHPEPVDDTPSAPESDMDESGIFEDEDEPSVFEDVLEDDDEVSEESEPEPMAYDEPDVPEAPQSGTPQYTEEEFDESILDDSPVEDDADMQDYSDQDDYDDNPDGMDDVYEGEPVENVEEYENAGGELDSEDDEDVEYEYEYEYVDGEPEDGEEDGDVEYEYEYVEEEVDDDEMPDGELEDEDFDDDEYEDEEVDSRAPRRRGASGSRRRGGEPASRSRRSRPRAAKEKKGCFGVILLTFTLSVAALSSTAYLLYRLMA